MQPKILKLRSLVLLYHMWLRPEDLIFHCCVAFRFPCSCNLKQEEEGCLCQRKRRSKSTCGSQPPILTSMEMQRIPCTLVQTYAFPSYVNLPFLGGTPLFNEMTGESVDRYDYVKQRHPNSPWIKWRLSWILQSGCIYDVNELLYKLNLIIRQRLTFRLLKLAWSNRQGGKQDFDSTRSLLGFGSGASGFVLLPVLLLVFSGAVENLLAPTAYVLCNFPTHRTGSILPSFLSSSFLLLLYDLFASSSLRHCQSQVGTLLCCSSFLEFSFGIGKPRREVLMIINIWQGRKKEKRKRTKRKRRQKKKDRKEHVQWVRRHSLPIRVEAFIE